MQKHMIVSTSSVQILTCLVVILWEDKREDSLSFFCARLSVLIVLCAMFERVYPCFSPARTSMSNVLLRTDWASFSVDIHLHCLLICILTAISCARCSPCIFLARVSTSFQSSPWLCGKNVSLSFFPNHQLLLQLLLVFSKNDDLLLLKFSFVPSMWPCSLALGLCSQCFSVSYHVSWLTQQWHVGKTVGTERVGNIPW